MLRLLTELRMFEKVTVTDAMAEDMDKLRPRLKNVHIRELVVAIIIMPKTQKPTFTCRRKGHCSHGQPWPGLTSSHPDSHPGSRSLLAARPPQPGVLRAFLHRPSLNPQPAHTHSTAETNSEKTFIWPLYQPCDLGRKC